jgi:hypothetical protein
MLQGRISTPPLIEFPHPPHKILWAAPPDDSPLSEILTQRLVLLFRIVTERGRRQCRTKTLPDSDQRLRDPRCK